MYIRHHSYIVVYCDAAIILFHHYIYTPTNIYKYYIIYANVNGHNAHLLKSSLTVVKPFYAFSISQTPLYHHRQHVYEYPYH